MTTYRYAVLIDADSPEDAAERIAEMIANEGILPDVLDVEQEAADTVEGWKVGDRFTWKVGESDGPRVILHVAETHLAFARTGDPGDWGTADLTTIDLVADRMLGTADMIAVK